MPEALQALAEVFVVAAIKEQVTAVCTALDKGATVGALQRSRIFAELLPWVEQHPHHLVQACDNLAQDMERRYYLSNRFLKACFFPVIIFLFAVIILLLLSLFVIPQI